MERFHWKEWMIAVLVASSGIANAFFWHALIADGGNLQLALFSLPLAALFLFAIFFSLSALFTEGNALGYTSVAVAFVGSFFFLTASPAIYIFLLTTLALGLWAYHRMQKEAALDVSFRLSKTLRQGLPLFFTAVALVVSVFYLSFHLAEAKSPVIPRALFDFSLPFLQNTLQGVIPGFQPSATVNQILLGAATKELGSNGDLSRIPKSQVDQFLQTQRQALSAGLGVPVTGDEKASDLLYTLANQKADALAGPYAPYLPYLSAFGFFLAVKVLTFPLYIVSLFLVFIAVRLLLIIGMLKREVTTIQVEHITL